MKDTLSNKLTSFIATLAVADTAAHQAIWRDQTPLSFTEELALARAGVTALGSAGAEQSAPITGTAEALGKLREALEERLHILARATYQFMKKAGRTEDAAKVDLTPSALHNARAVNLVGIGETVLNLAEPLTLPPAPGQAALGQAALGVKSGITAGLFTQVDDLWGRYSIAVGAPTGVRSKRKTLTAGLPGKFSAVEEMFSDLDDIIIQFGTTKAANAPASAKKPNSKPTRPSPKTSPSITGTSEKAPQLPQKEVPSEQLLPPKLGHPVPAPPQIISSPHPLPNHL